MRDSRALLLAVVDILAVCAAALLLKWTVAGPPRAEPVERLAAPVVASTIETHGRLGARRPQLRFALAGIERDFRYGLDRAQGPILAALVVPPRLAELDLDAARRIIAVAVDGEPVLERRHTEAELRRAWLWDLITILVLLALWLIVKPSLLTRPRTASP
jgi:sulfur carrier protein ThiS